MSDHNGNEQPGPGGAGAEQQRDPRVEAPGDLAVEVVHELNNLLTVVGGSVEQARARPSSKRQAAQLARAAWGVERAGRLTRQILGAARGRPPGAAPADLGELVQGMAGLVAEVVGAGIEARLELAPEPLPVRVDAGRLELALLNLVRNAADAMPGGGRLTIRTGALAPAEAGRLVALVVSDTGAGMTPEAARRATEPFFTTKPPGRGTGLGLSLARGFAERSGGRLEVASAPGGGTHVAIVLPRREDGPHAG